VRHGVGLRLLETQSRGQSPWICWYCTICRVRRVCLGGLKIRTVGYIYQKFV